MGRKNVERLHTAVHDVTHYGSLSASLLAISNTAKSAAKEHVNKADYRFHVKILAIVVKH